MRRKKRKLRVSFDLKLNLTRISYVKFDDPSNLMTLLLIQEIFFLRYPGISLVADQSRSLISSTKKANRFQSSFFVTI